MTSSNLSTNQKKLALSNFKSYWWLGLVCSIVYFFAGPVFMMLSWQNEMRHMGGELSLELRGAQFFGDWFYLNGFIAFYFLGMVVAIVLSVVVFSYLHSKRQVNFYHALPINRTKLFLQRYGLGFLLAYVPLVVMVLLMVLLSGIYGGLSYVSFLGILAHLGRIFLFMLISYSLGILAAQFTGTILTHICLTLVFYFGVVVVLACTFLLNIDTFWGTFDTESKWLGWILNTSPATYLANYIDQVATTRTLYTPLYNGVDIAQTAAPSMGMVPILVILVLSALLSLGAWWLYQKRPSEKAGESLIYDVSKPIFKWILMYIAASVGGFLFLNIGGKGFFIFGFLSFALLIHMFSEVVIHKDFKALLKNMKGFVAFAVLISLFYLGLYWDITGYNDYVPEDSTKMASVTIEMFGLDLGRDGHAYTTEKNMETIFAFLNQVVETKSYDRNDALYENVVLGYVATTNLSVTYTFDNGKEVRRKYRGVPLTLLEEGFGEIYNSEEYKSLNYGSVLADSANWTNYDVSHILGLNQERLDTFSYQSQGVNKDTMDEAISAYDPYLDLWVAALQKDLSMRDFADLQQAPLYSFDFTVKKDTESRMGRESYDIPIYATDINCMAVIEQMVADKRLGSATIADMAASITQLAIYQIKEVPEDEGYKSYPQPTNNLSWLLEEGKVTLVETIEDPAIIAQLLPKIALENQLSSGAPFLQVDSGYMIGVFTKGYTHQDLEEANDTRKSTIYDTGYFLKNQVPAQYVK